MLRGKQLIGVLAIVVASLGEVCGASFRQHVVLSSHGPPLPSDLFRLTGDSSQYSGPVYRGLVRRSHETDEQGPNMSAGALPAMKPDAADDSEPEVGIHEVTFGAYDEEQRPIDFDLNHRTNVVFVPGEKSVLDLPVGQ